MSKLYGSLTNRLEEGINYNEDKLIHEGDDITEYLWSDRHCYFVTSVIDQTHIMVKKYEVVADKEKHCGMGHQNWLYFKTCKERNEYLKKIYPNSEYRDEENTEELWELHRGTWKRVEFLFNEDLLKRAQSDKGFTNPEAAYNYYTMWLTDAQRNRLQTKGFIKVYRKLSGNVSFGVRDYYYDWEF